MITNSYIPEHGSPEVLQPIVVICSTMPISVIYGQHRQTTSSYSKASIVGLG